MNHNETPAAFLASVLIHLMLLLAAARWLDRSGPVPQAEPLPEAPPPERITRVILPPPEVWRPPAPPSQSRRAAPNPPERPQPRPEAKDRVSIGGPAAERQKTPLELRRDQDLTRSVARGRPDAPGTPAGAPKSAPAAGARPPAPAAEVADAPLAPSAPPAAPRRPGRPSIAGSLRNLEERLAQGSGPRGAASGAGQQMGALFFDPQGADFTAWINQFKNEVYRNWIMPPSVTLGARGHVDIQFRVERDGRVSALQIVRSSGTPALDRAARNALLGGRFLPLPSDFRPDQVVMDVSFFYNPVAGS